MYLALVDQYNNIVGNTNSAKISVSVNTSVNNATSLLYPPTLSGNLSFIASAGVFNISGINFTSYPGYSYSKSHSLYHICLEIVLSTDGIDETKPSNIKYL